MRGPIIEKALLWLLAVSAAAHARNATNASETCDIIVRIGYPEGLAPYAVAAPTRWLDGDGACFAFYRHQTGQRALEKLEGGDFDIAIFGTSVFGLAVERGATITFVWSVAPDDDLWANSPPGSRTNASTPREVSWTDPEAVERRHITLQPTLPKEPSPEQRGDVHV